MKLGRREYWQASCTLLKSIQVPKHMREHVVELTRLHVPKDARRMKNGTGLMTLVCAEADAERKTLLIHCKPYDDGPEVQELRAFYERFGFMEIQPDPLLMARPVTGLMPAKTLIAEVCQ